MVSLVNESEKIEQLKKLTESLFGPEESIFSSKYSAPFDISRPNIHDSKKEFIRELITVTAVKDHLRGTLDLLLQSISPEDRDPLQTAMTKRLSVAIETFALQRVKSETLDGASDLGSGPVKSLAFAVAY